MAILYIFLNKCQVLEDISCAKMKDLAKDSTKNIFTPHLKLINFS